MRPLFNDPIRWILLLVLFLSLAHPAAAQLPGSGTEAPWPAASAGFRLGYDNNNNGELLGAQLRIPILRSGRLELVPNGDVTFITRLKEYQGSVDLVFMTRGRNGGAYVGGGIGVRNTIFGTDPASPRETRRGYSAVVGLKSGGGGTFGTQLELRWIFIDGAPFDPQTVSLGINFPLWGRRDGGRR